MGRTVRALRKILVTIVGFTVLLAGIIMLVTPGPGWLGIIGGLVILSTEFEWAERYLQTARNKLKQANEKIRNKKKRKRKD